MLQQAENAVCPNCSNNMADSVAGEIISPEEALPEEMAPDQEPPAIPTPAKPPAAPEQVDVKDNLIKMAVPSNSSVNAVKTADKKTPAVITSLKPHKPETKGDFHLPYL